MPDLSLFKSNTYFFRKKFIFTIYKGIYRTKITMECRPEAMNTGQLPHTYSTLYKFLPSVLTTKCYNQQNNPFTTEVKKTEMAHLFEHVLLEYLCQYKIAAGARRASVAGVTDWNWKKDPYGTFHITIGVGKAENDVFNQAFKKSLALFEVLLNEKQTVSI